METLGAIQHKTNTLRGRLNAFMSPLGLKHRFSIIGDQSNASRVGHDGPDHACTAKNRLVLSIFKYLPWRYCN